MTLNGVMVVILRYFTKFGKFGPSYVKMVEVRPVLFVRKCSHFPTNLVFGNFIILRLWYSAGCVKRGISSIKSENWI